MKRIYRLWTKIEIGINEEALDTDRDYFIGIDTGKKYSKSDYYISEYYKAIIKNVDKKNKTGMCHLYKDKNRVSFKKKYLNSIVSVRKAHFMGKHTIYYCHELNEYFSDDEIEILE